MKKYLITGCEGFVGTHLADYLIGKGDIFGTVFGDSHQLKHLDGKIKIIDCDLKDGNQVKDIVQDIVPDVVFHLAAQSLVTISWEKPEETLNTNIMGTFYLLDSLAKVKPSPIVIVVGSSSVYGPRKKFEMPINENTDFRPTSIYALSKVSEDMMGYLYANSYGMKIIRTRPFNMTGPRKLYDACSDFSKAIVEVEKGVKQIVEVGNLDTIRDFTDGRDAVRALVLLAEKGKFGEVYNICSGHGINMKAVLSKLISLSTKNIEYRMVSEKQREIDDPIYVGDNSKLLQLGWKLRIPIEETLKDMLDWWREEIRG